MRLSPFATVDHARPGPAVTTDDKRPGPAVTTDERPGPAVTADDKRPSPAITADDKRPGLAITADDKRPGSAVAADDKLPSSAVTADDTPPGPSVSANDMRPSLSATADDVRPNPTAIFMMLAMVAVSAVPTTGWAQCCSPGNPIGGRSSLGALPGGEGSITATYSHSRSEAYYQGSSVVDPIFVDGGFFHHVSVNGAYAISGRVTIESEVTYFASKVQEYVDGALPASRKGFGLGDWSATINVNLFRDRRTRWEVTSGVGLKYPLGTYRQTRDGALLPLDIQTTTGAVDFRHTLFIYKGYPNRGFRMFAVNHIDVKTANPDGYRYGNLVSTSVFASAQAGLRWDAALQVRSEVRARDHRETGPIPVTGSTKVFLSPQLSYAVSQTLVATMFVDVPIYQYYRGGQLGSTVAFSIGLIRRFGRSKLDTDDPPPLFR